VSFKHARLSVQQPFPLPVQVLTYSMEQSPSWEAKTSWATQEIPRILGNPKVHHRIHKSSPPVPILRPVQVHYFNARTISFIWIPDMILSCSLQLKLAHERHLRKY
jgi:hypothetical protein